MGKKKDDNWIYSYYQKVKDGSIAVGHYIELILEYLVRGLEDKSFFYDQKKANAAIDWIEEHAFHTEGKLAPNPLKLELWEKAFIAALFGVVDADGKRQFREAVLIVARKNGKSLLAAAIAKYEWWIDGGFGAKIYNIAPKLDQADIIYNNIWQMTLLDPEYQLLKEELSEKDMHNKKVKDDSILPKHRMSDLYITATNSTVKKIAFSAKKSDGFNPSLCVCDEIASWEGDAGLKQYEVMKSGMGAREEGILLSCTTAGYINDSIYDEIFKRSTRFLKGDSKEKKLLPFLYVIDDIEKWNDINELRKSNPNLGVSVSVDFMLEEIAIAEGSLSKKAEFITKYCNLKQNSSLAWLDTSTVNRCFGDPLDLEDFRSSYAICGIDLSQTTDLTAATLVIEKNGELYVFAKFWLPAEKIDDATARDGLPYNIYIQRGLLAPSGDNFVDYRDCYAWLTEMVEKYEILPLMVGYDRYSAQYLIQDLQQYGFRCDDVFQGDNLWGVLQEMEGLMKDGRVHCGDNDLLKVHLLNSAIKMNVERGRGKLIKLNANAHIDGCAALADAFCVRQKWYGEMGDQLQNRG
ncbi:MAG: terminase large subunit [Clostridiales bacterium]|nr:terminase large subunit [Clostridiales bacterium]